MTVGEMIAAHHARDATRRYQQAEMAWYTTDIGRAFGRFEDAHERAVVATYDLRISDKTLRIMWERHNKARDEFLTLVRR